jgi:dephospho-CoA kinase
MFLDENTLRFIDPAFRQLYEKELAVLKEEAHVFGARVVSASVNQNIAIEYVLDLNGIQRKLLGSARPLREDELRQHFINEIQNKFLVSSAGECAPLLAVG